MNGSVTSHLPSGEAIVYDLEGGRIVEEISAYSLWLLDNQRKSPLTVRQTVEHLVRFWSYLPSGLRGVSDVSDQLVAAFAEREFGSVRNNSRSRGSDRAARATVNKKLSAVFNWLFWLQNSGRCPQDTIGPNECKVSAHSKKPLPNGQRWLPGCGISSLHLFSNAGTSGAPTSVGREVFDSVRSYIDASTATAYIAERDKLFLDIATNAGFRRGSICSLVIEDLSAAIARSTTAETLEVRPQVQKFQYRKVFEVETLLILRALDFVEGPRAQLIQQLRIDERTTGGRIFLSASTGRPMSDRAMTHRISVAMRAVGCNKGMAIHVFRGLYSNEALEADISRRVKLGLDTSTESLSYGLAAALGQDNPMSPYSYVASQQSRLARKRLACGKAAENKVEDE